VLSGVEDDISIDEKDSKYTNPYEVAEFVARTKCDSIAVAHEIIFVLRFSSVS
jgi:fructose-bisphosphate aldolase class II